MFILWKRLIFMNNFYFFTCDNIYVYINNAITRQCTKSVFVWPVPSQVSETVLLHYLTGT